MEKFFIRKFKQDDENSVIELWKACNLTVKWNDPLKDIQRKQKSGPDLFFVGTINSRIVASAMAGYDGHRGWIYYLCVLPEMQKKGYAKQIVMHAEKKLKSLGCPKINLMVRDSNINVQEFYKKAGYKNDPVIVLSKRLIDD